MFSVTIITVFRALRALAAEDEPRGTVIMDRAKLAAADELFQRSASIRAVQGREMNPFSQALEVLERIAEVAGAPIAIVGGLAAIHHNVGATTVDVDIVVGFDRIEEVVEEAQRQGLHVTRQSPGGWHALRYEDAAGTVDIQIVPEGAKTPRDPPHAPPVPSPQELGVRQGLDYASFAGWVAMKLVANRDKDRYHLVEAFKAASQEQIAEVVQSVRSMDSAYLKELLRLIRAAEDEDSRKW